MGKSLFDHQMPRYFSIDAGQDFLDSLAKASMESVDFDPLALAQIEIYLPTRRAMRNLATAFIRQADGKASLLPRIQAIGALDDDIVSLNDEGTPFDSAELLPAISTMERRLTLAHLTARQNEKFAGSKNWIAALGAARELEKILDSFYTEDIPFDALDKISFETLDLASHWEISRDFLKIVTDSWPAYLAECKKMDPTARRIALIHRAADQWEKSPPQHPVIIAGSTGSTPAVARLMKITANLPKGCVILPGVDLALDERAWDNINDAHPQAGLYALINKSGLERANIYPFSNLAARQTNTARQMLLSLALRPAETTDDWLVKIKDIAQNDWELATDSLSLIEADDEEGEASAIAIVIREALNAPDKKIMLVTPDRDLTRRVISKCKRWDIDIDDSAGIPFANCERGTFLQLVARWMDDISDPVLLLSVLRHPLCNPQTGDLFPKDALAILDKALRGLKPPPGLSGIKSKLANYRHEKDIAKLTPLMEWLDGVLTSFTKASSEAISFADMLRLHIEISEALTIAVVPSKDTDQDQSILWRGEDGVETASILSSLKECGHLVNTSDYYAEIFSSLISGETVRRHRATHPRVTILGPLEARLQTGDHIILGGLNEGVWPGEANLDGFLSRDMREKIGLPSPERRIGLAAHDFSQLASSEYVTITRAKRAGNAPAKPSRWIIRLKNILTASIGLESVDCSALYAHYALTLNTPTPTPPIEKPCPRPPIEARPRELYVTRIEKWLRDPYFIYGRDILKLYKLDKFNEEFSYRYVGILVHAAFEKFAKQRPTKDDTISREEDLAHLQMLMAIEVESLSIPYDISQIWQPALAKSMDWFVDWHRMRLTEGRAKVMEEKGSCEIKTAGHSFTINAYVDRIDVMAQGDEPAGLAIYDYKTGQLPTEKQGKKFNPQLALTGIIAQRNGFENINTTRVNRLAFVKTLGRKSSDPGCPAKDSIVFNESAIEDAHEGLVTLIEKFDLETTPYLSQPRPEFKNDYGDYDLLARRKEWADSESDEEEEGEG